VPVAIGRRKRGQRRRKGGSRDAIGGKEQEVTRQTGSTNIRMQKTKAFILARKMPDWARTVLSFLGNKVKWCGGTRLDSGLSKKHSTGMV